MNMLRKPLAAALGLAALVVLLHFTLSPFYEDSVDVGEIWNALNWVMAFGVIATLAATCVLKRDAGEDAGADRSICVNAAFYAAAVLAVLFFWNWFDDLTAGAEGQSDTRSIYWVVINTLFVVLAGAVSACLWRDAGS